MDWSTKFLSLMAFDGKIQAAWSKQLVTMRNQIMQQILIIMNDQKYWEANIIILILDFDHM